MIRVGLTWHDRTYQIGLTKTNRVRETEALAAAAEAATQASPRGLWADARPVSPWEFRP